MGIGSLEEFGLRELAAICELLPLWPPWAGDVGTTRNRGRGVGSRGRPRQRRGAVARSQSKVRRPRRSCRDGGREREGVLLGGGGGDKDEDQSNGSKTEGPFVGASELLPPGRASLLSSLGLGLGSGSGPGRELTGSALEGLSKEEAANRKTRRTKTDGLLNFNVSTFLLPLLSSPMACCHGVGTERVGIARSWEQLGVSSRRLGAKSRWPRTWQSGPSPDSAGLESEEACGREPAGTSGEAEMRESGWIRGLSHGGSRAETITHYRAGTRRLWPSCSAGTKRRPGWDVHGRAGVPG